jgi:predicted TIM-barrel fold metal-dependent hydrolase
MQLISVDDHVMEHPRVWTDRLARKYHDSGPRVGEHDDGSQYWLFEDTPNECLIQIGVTVGFDREQFGWYAVRYEDMAPGAYDPRERVTDMDIAGVHAELCFPSVPRFAGTLFLNSKDPELALLSVKAFNDFMVEEWCAAAPERFIPLGIVPLWDPQLAAAEVYRCAEMGIRTISFVENFELLKLPSYYTNHWDPVLRAAEETNLPLSIHIGSSGAQPVTSPDAPPCASIALVGLNSMACLSDLVFSNVFGRFPGLKVALSEGGVGWLPYMTERIDYTWNKQMYWNDINRDRRPSEVIREHIYGCFIDDQVGVDLRDRIGVDHIMWEQDYPHSDTVHPHSRKRAAEMLIDVPDDDAHKISELNARTLYNFPATMSP